MLEPRSTGDAWKVTVEQWNRIAETDEGITYGGERLPDFIAYAIAHTADEAARIIEAATTSKHGPRTRVIKVEHAGPAWQAAEKWQR